MKYDALLEDMTLEDCKRFLGTPYKKRAKRLYDLIQKSEYEYKSEVPLEQWLEWFEEVTS